VGPRETWVLPSLQYIKKVLKMNMLKLTCKNHPDLFWLTKSIAWTPGHGYNGTRNIFFYGAENGDLVVDGKVLRECPCPAHDLVLAPGQEEPKE
jgi:hypothetical protein